MLSDSIIVALKINQIVSDTKIDKGHLKILLGQRWVTHYDLSELGSDIIHYKLASIHPRPQVGIDTQIQFRNFNLARSFLKRVFVRNQVVIDGWIRVQRPWHLRELWVLILSLQRWPLLGMNSNNPVFKGRLMTCTPFSSVSAHARIKNLKLVLSINDVTVELLRE